jgi:hypothetical protein
MRNALTGPASYEGVLQLEPSGAVRGWRYAEQASWCLTTTLKMMNSFHTAAPAQWSCRLCFSSVEWSNYHFKSIRYKETEIISRLNSVRKLPRRGIISSSGPIQFCGPHSIECGGYRELSADTAIAVWNLPPSWSEFKNMWSSISFPGDRAAGSIPPLPHVWSWLGA